MESPLLSLHSDTGDKCMWLIVEAFYVDVNLCGNWNTYYAVLITSVFNVGVGDKPNEKEKIYNSEKKLLNCRVKMLPRIERNRYWYKLWIRIIE